MAWSQTNYNNPNYGFKLEVPEDWHVYAEIKDDPVQNHAIVSWGIPKVYSEIDKVSVENAISIIARKKPELKSLEDHEKFEFDRLKSILIKKELIAEAPHKTYITNTMINGLVYKSKSAIMYKNNIGYILTLTGTPGTFGLNEAKFDLFVNSINFFKVDEANETSSNVVIPDNATYKLKMDGSDFYFDKKANIPKIVRFFSTDSVKIKYTTLATINRPMNINDEMVFDVTGHYKIVGSEIEIQLNEAKDVLDSTLVRYSIKVAGQNKIFLQETDKNGRHFDYWLELIHPKGE